jgi:hypothetical protein
MTPKEKAQELLNKMQLDWGCNCCHNDWAKDCALVAVDEIINLLGDITNNEIDYWESVKKEIELI